MCKIVEVEIPVYIHVAQDLVTFLSSSILFHCCSMCINKTVSFFILLLCRFYCLCSSQVGEVWLSSQDKCVMQQCVKVGDGVFISASNVSCSNVETPSCPIGTELQCNTQDCCPRCHCGTQKHTHIEEATLI